MGIWVPRACSVTESGWWWRRQQDHWLGILPVYIEFSHELCLSGCLFSHAHIRIDNQQSGQKDGREQQNLELLLVEYFVCTTVVLVYKNSAGLSLVEFRELLWNRTIHEISLRFRSSSLIN